VIHTWFFVSNSKDGIYFSYFSKKSLSISILISLQSLNLSIVSVITSVADLFTALHWYFKVYVLHVKNSFLTVCVNTIIYQLIIRGIIGRYSVVKKYFLIHLYQLINADSDFPHRKLI